MYFLEAMLPQSKDLATTELSLIWYVDHMIEFLQCSTTTLIMIDLHGTEDLPHHQRHISRVPPANMKLSGRFDASKANIYRQAVSVKTPEDSLNSLPEKRIPLPC